jgi:hypothetical protein
LSRAKDQRKLKALQSLSKRGTKRPAEYGLDTQPLTESHSELPSLDLRQAALVPCPLPPAVDLAHARRGVAELTQLLTSPRFRRQFIGVQMLPERELIERKLWTANRHICKYLHAVAAEQAALTLLREQGVAGSEETAAEFRLRHKDLWRETRKSLTRVRFELAGREFDLDLSQRRDFPSALRRAVTNSEPAFEEQTQALYLRLEVKRARAEQQLALLADTLGKRAEDPLVLAAMDVWGCSCNAAGDRGPQGEGFHAGVIHYFEYHAVPAKRFRFSHEPLEAFGLDGFVQYSSRMHALLMTADAGRLPAIKIADAEGRLRLVTQDGSLFIVGYRKPGESLRLITAYPTRPLRLTDDWEHLLKRELSGEAEEYRFNKLGPGLRVLASPA